MKKYWKLLLIFVALVIFYLLLTYYFDNELSYIDEIIYDVIILIKSNFTTKLMLIISNLCHTIFLIIFILLFYLVTKNKNYLTYMSLNLLMATSINSFIKILVKRPRPTSINLIIEKGFSFPSGHAMCSMAFYGLLIFIIYSMNINKYLKISLCSFLSILILLIGISRIYLGVHYATDVIAGICLGSAYLLVFTSVFESRINK